MAAAYAVVLMLFAHDMVTQDSWLALVAGREIVTEGLPRTDRLTIWTRGTEWVDQQWLAHVAVYGVVVAGGLKLALLAHVAVLAASFAGALAVARTRGASARSVGAVAVACFLATVSNSALRAQTLAYPLFVGLLALLVSDARRRSPRVFLFVPLLVLWANVHGSVVLGAILVVLAGVAHAVFDVRSGKRAIPTGMRSGALVLAPPLCVLASPYGMSLVDYYRRVLANSTLADAVAEWRPTSFPADWPFFVLALGGGWLLARHGRRLTGFERLAFAATLVFGLLAVRNVVWFALVSAVVLPLAVEELAPASRTAARRVWANLLLAGAAASCVVAVAAVTFSHRDAWFASRYPGGAANAVSAVADRDASAKILAHERFADWLLWSDPRLAGRVAYDARFELLPDRRVTEILEFFNQVGADWSRPADPYRVLVLDSAVDGGLAQRLLGEGDARLVYRDASVTVVVRGTGPTR